MQDLDNITADDCRKNLEDWLDMAAASPVHNVYDKLCGIAFKQCHYFVNPSPMGLASIAQRRGLNPCPAGIGLVAGSWLDTHSACY